MFVDANLRAVPKTTEFYLFDGKKQKEYQAVSNFTFSSNDCHYFYLATKQNGKTIVVIDGKESPEYDEVETSLVWDFVSRLLFVHMDTAGFEFDADRMQGTPREQVNYLIDMLSKQRPWGQCLEHSQNGPIPV